jgi:hypothetical protein
MSPRMLALAAALPLAFTFGAAAAEQCVCPPAPAMTIGSQLQPFFDDALIDSRAGVELKLHEPQPQGTVIVFNRPWEGNNSAYVTIFQDGGRYRMYYRGVSEPGYQMKSLAPRAGDVTVPANEMVTCCAESTDGITWTRPDLELFEFNHSKANNIVWRGEAANNFSPFLDGNPAAPADQRYKAVASIDDKGPASRPWLEHHPVLLAFVSPDGIHWKQLRAQPIITDGKFDSLNVVFWDALRHQYTAIYRDFVHGVRTIKYSSSKDFLNWAPGQLADFGCAPEEHLYTNATVPYARAPQIYLAMPRRFLPWKTAYQELETIGHPGLSDGLFMSSRDGVHWYRFEEAFIRPGLDGRNWIHRANTPVRGMIQTSPEEISIYVERNYTTPSNQVQRLTLRTDGFVSAHAGVPGGEFVTKPLLFTGGRLFLNYSTAAAGSIRIEIEDARGQPLPGFLLEESPLIFGDKIEEVVSWNHPAGETDNGPLAHLAGLPIRLRFVMRDADLYSLRFR